MIIAIWSIFLINTAYKEKGFHLFSFRDKSLQEQWLTRSGVNLLAQKLT